MKRKSSKVAWRNQQLSRQRNRCYYCNCLMDTKRYPAGEQLPGNACTIDHVVPRARGGTNNRENLVLACLDCNHDKDKTMPLALQTLLESTLID